MLWACLLLPHARLTRPSLPSHCVTRTHADPIAARWYESLAGLQLLYFNLARGVLDSDPFKVRARVLQLLRSAKDDADVGSPVRDGAARAHGQGHGHGHGAGNGAAGGGGAGGKRANGASGANKGGAMSRGTKAAKGDRGRPSVPKREDSSSSAVVPALPFAAPPSPPNHAHHGLPNSLSGLVSPLDGPGPLNATAAGGGGTSDGGPFAPLYAGAPTPTSALFPAHPLALEHSHPHGAAAHTPSQHSHSDSGPSPADLGLLPVPGDFSFDLSGAGSLGLGGLGLSTLDEWGAGYYFGGSNWGLGGFGGLGVAPGAYGGPGPQHGAPSFGGGGGDMGWGGL